MTLMTVPSRKTPEGILENPAALNLSIVTPFMAVSNVNLVNCNTTQFSRIPRGWVLY